ncbi:PP2C family serine/threonine-protein phosphatase [Streptomyces sp. 4N509B]|uniref:PP2C family serine/threonine-protein phosphatase n=1 Tax=Streptomyces sp. 4N509B TaxID=3457413 RepID=UPI003FCF0B9D
MPQLDQVSACPGCGEPLEEDDRFCGVCGTRLHAGARGSGGHDGPGGGSASGGPVVEDPTMAVRTPTEPDFTLPPPQPPHAHAHPPHPGPPAAPAASQGPPPSPPSPPPPPPAVPPLVPPGGFGQPAASAAPPAAAPPAAHQPPAPPAAPAAPAPHQPQDPRAAQEHPQPAGPPAPAVPDPRTRDASPPARESHPVTCSVCRNGYVDPDGYCEECGRAQPGERDHVERALGGVAAVSDLGLRHHRNEDAFAVSATALPDGSPAVIAVVCDGVSSSSRPDEASAAAAEAAQEFLLHALPHGVSGQQAMHDALVTAAHAVAELADDQEREPGRNAPACTIVSAVTASGTLTVGWIGDSRAYWLPLEDEAGSGGTGAPARLTEDDSWAAQMVAAGLLSEAEAMADHRAHAITAWLGADAQEIDPHTASFKPDRPGVVIVCTDGLWNYAETADQMASLVSAEARVAPLSAARRLVQYALDSGGHDNVTVALIPFPVAADRAGRA